MAETPAEAPLVHTGSFVFIDGSKYDGQFIEEEGKKSRHGNGTFVDGPETYAGSWVNDAMEGEGTFNFASGATYVGCFANSQFDGEGKYTWADGASYQGGWKQNKMHGKGLYIDTEFVRWKGDFHNGKFFNGKSYITLR
mmetsp:Transcript_70155/g.196345  ORF Transcript_70155/g.196345 Transcript_70155/m.196345 type:complete len:139 (+) Transcript_70155:44-460(+)|eukprot:CAMPEP_0119542546 /NCGR_PEP_ID=MMETSP1344-20130328/53646_1 /TAXON_ID=236787 /ORGANISM="Florenciella parvula, Strain CCMP2471" /LENGTH=138 /DNA_ID=CAMNT_0007586777 /DNA_START=44 /DNA_END=460 /DNA_ORIENTATION=-